MAVRWLGDRIDLNGGWFRPQVTLRRLRRNWYHNRFESIDKGGKAGTGVGRSEDLPKKVLTVASCLWHDEIAPVRPGPDNVFPSG
ncbi:hypothetical protein JWG42_12495 [Desulfoprunum benzoelyticum]|uniref:Uncharacterized protein n=1 Tax=Desulfoprunum benzoelyticum TaxID=1506996 RepID=A0A840V8I8_9BACT|nr:hypothetical protein [Desulfoprunum benzoelyticum]MBB5349281.1 hypothetical protein [Desulfoprunum benzoelyticum]MBM9530971.1 hypothetical protein [Desulfoprunum benzoelyticum]